MQYWRFLVGIFILSFALGIILTQSTHFLSTQKPIDMSAITGEYDPNDQLGLFHGQTSAAPLNLSLNHLAHPILGTSTSNKRIEIDLANQRLYAYEGDNQIYNFLISSGKWGKTPTGNFTIWIKLRYTKMSGGSKALNTYYYLPNVPYTMYFSNAEVPSWQGYGIHGAYWHNNFGHPMSHGCINMKIEEAGLLYHWAEPIPPPGKTSIRASKDNPGTPVIIYGVAPTN